jgi:hypothetical protein
MNTDSESARLVARTYFRRWKISKKRSKVDEIGVSCQESSRSLTTRKYIRGMN